MRSFILLGLLFSVFFIGCNSDYSPLIEEKKNENTSQEEGASMKLLSSKSRVFTVASEQLAGLSFSCGIEEATMVYAVMEEPNKDWFALWNPIQGFEYAAGYEYVIEVEQKTFYDPRKGEPVWDEFIIVKVISMEEKKSENLPFDFLPEE